MAYLGRNLANLSDRVVLDSLTASATASYTLQLNSVNFVPSSAESLTVSLNGVIQAPISSYTVSGSSIVFASSLSASDSIDFIIAERGITLQTPSAGSVGTSQLASGAVNNSKIASDAAIATTKLGTGAVLQVVQGNYSTQTDSTSGSAVATGLSVNITPQFSNSKIFVSYSLPLRNGVSSNNFILSYLYRDGSSIALTGILKADSSGINGHVTAEILDTPATTSQVTYAAYVNPRGYTTQWCGAGTRATITAMEIAG